MTANKPEARSITDKGWMLFETIKAAGTEGITRAGLAAAIDKPTLNKWDIAQLEILEREGLITVERRIAPKQSHLLEYVYRALPIASDGGTLP
ncbi:MAG: hypothetical protein SF123_02850 [Chloroflexota bacterium]|nr:hypothetical protein [Chloroflexota bacterium]